MPGSGDFSTGLEKLLKTFDNRLDLDFNKKNNKDLLSLTGGNLQKQEVSGKFLFVPVGGGTDRWPLNRDHKMQLTNGALKDYY